jgi:WhiB family redox-sensing transcriptional regulator
VALTTWNWDDGWRSRPACRGSDPDLFFPVGTTGQAIQNTESAKQVCQECEARSECLEFALTARIEYGIWGGTSEDERRRLSRARRMDR